jgi:transglutaminase-like putative cysteine protease
MEGKHHAQLLTGVILLALFCSLAVPATADITYWNPRPYNVTYIFELEPDPNKIDRAKDLKLWLPVPREWDSQKSVQILSIDPPPDGTYEDPEFGNRMAFWDFGKGPEKAVYTATIKYRLESYDIKVDVDPNKVGAYDKSSAEYKLYTRSEHTICLTPKIYELAKEAVGDEKNPYLQARRIAQYAYKKVHGAIVEFDRGRGIQCLLDYPAKDPKTGEEYYEGACSQKSAFVVALCRAVGIPARCVAGYYGWPPANDLKPLYDFETKLSPGGLAQARSYGQLGAHMWTEFYIPNYGWIPQDQDYMAMPYNCRTVWFKGRDIKLGPQYPAGENPGYGTQWFLVNESRADMLGYGIWNIAKIHTARVKSLFEFDPFPADALVAYLARLHNESKTNGMLKDWRHSVLEKIDYRMRGVTDTGPALAAEFKKSDLSDQRNALVCHLLRDIVGADKFAQLVSQYEKMRVGSGKAIPTARFQQLSEAAYGQSLEWFFEQWTEETQLPQLKLGQVSIDKQDQDWRVSGHLLQTGKLFYRLPVRLALQTERGIESRTLWQEKRDTEFQLHTSQRPVRLTVDPNYEIPKIQRCAPHFSWFGMCEPNDVQMIYGSREEKEANKAAAEAFGQLSGIQSIKADTEATATDLNAKYLILVGRPAVNKITERLQDRFPVKFEGARFTWQGKVYDKATQGVFAIVDEGRSSKRLTILFAGLSADATMDFPKITAFPESWAGSYLVFDGDKCILSGDWDIADPDLVREF